MAAAYAKELLSTIPSEGYSENAVQVEGLVTQQPAVSRSRSTSSDGRKLKSVHKISGVTTGKNQPLIFSSDGSSLDIGDVAAQDDPVQYMGAGGSKVLHTLLEESNFSTENVAHADNEGMRTLLPLTESRAYLSEASGLQHTRNGDGSNNQGTLLIPEGGANEDDYESSIDSSLSLSTKKKTNSGNESQASLLPKLDMDNIPLVERHWTPSTANFTSTQDNQDIWRNYELHRHIYNLLRKSGVEAEPSDTIKSTLIPKETEGDSGYGSNSRRETISLHSVMYTQHAVEQLTTDNIRSLNDNMQLKDEIESIVSEKDEINSDASHETTDGEKTGKALIRIFLANEPQYLALCEKVLAQMGQQRFVNSTRKLLRSFYKNLLEEAETKSQKVVAQLLRGRRGRQRISEQLAAHIQSAHEETSEFDKKFLEASEEEKYRVEKWLSSTSADTEPVVDDVQDSHFVAQNPHNGLIEDKFNHITEVENFLRESNSLRHLLTTFMFMFLPVNLRHTLKSIPKEQRIKRTRSIDCTY